MKLNRFLNSSAHKGVTLIEALVDVALLALLSTVIITALLGTLRTVTQSGIISSSGQLVNEKMETIRNLPYDSLATQHGPIFPQGNILDDEFVTRNGKTLHVHTDIQYVDDPYDGLVGGSPNDLNPADYKKISITIFDTSSGKQLTELTTDIASRAAETASNTGVLKITVLNASGIGVDSPNLVITNNTVNPPVNITTQGDTNGINFIPNLPLASHYHIVASKNGYSTDATAATTPQNLFPTNPDATVLLQQVTPVTLNIDATATLNLTALGLASATPTVTITGQKLIGSNPNVVKTTITHVISDTTVINDLEYDSYTITPPAGWYITTCTTMQPFAVSPGLTVNQTCTFTQNASDITIKTILPTTVVANASSAMTITGTNFTAVTVSIQLGAATPIVLSGLTPDATHQTLSGTVNFNGVPPGTYDVIITNSGGSVTQVAGLIVQ